MVITDGYVVAQVYGDGSGTTGPISQHYSLREAADWLIKMYTRKGETKLLSQYNPSLYVVEKWSDGEKTGRLWQIEANGEMTKL